MTSIGGIPIIVDIEHKFIDLSSFKKINIIVFTLMSATSLVYTEFFFSVGVVVGGAFVTGNVFLVSWIINKAMQGRDENNRVKFSPSYLGLAVLKTFVLFGGVVLAVLYFKVNCVGFLAGVSVVFISLFIELTIRQLIIFLS